MPDLAGFATFARKVGVPLVPQAAPMWGTGRGTEKTYTTQGFDGPVPLVPLVPPQNDEVLHENQLNDEYEERAAILEYDEGLPRAEAERLAAEQIFGRISNAA